MAIFDKLTKTHGPPGTYTFSFKTAGVANTLSHSIKDVSSVARLEFQLSPNKGPKNPIRIGEPIVTEMAFDRGVSAGALRRVLTTDNTAKTLTTDEPRPLVLSQRLGHFLLQYGQCP